MANETDPYASRIDELKEKKRIMLVEDNEGLLRNLQLTMQFEGHYPIPARDGEEALHRIKLLKNKYDLLPHFILSDVRMPKVTGDQLCRELKSDPTYKNIPIYFFSGEDEYHLQELVNKTGADGYLIKTARAGKIIETINKAIGI